MDYPISESPDFNEMKRADCTLIDAKKPETTMSKLRFHQSYMTDNDE